MKTYQEIQQEISERNLSINEYGIAVDESGNEYRDEDGCIIMVNIDDLPVNPLEN